MELETPTVWQRRGTTVVILAEVCIGLVVGSLAFLRNSMFVNDGIVDVATYPWWREAWLSFAWTLPFVAFAWIVAFGTNRWIFTPLLRWPRSRGIRVATAVTVIFLAGSAAGALLFGLLEPHF